jgi:hypothetical protein
MIRLDETTVEGDQSSVTWGARPSTLPFSHLSVLPMLGRHRRGSRPVTTRDSNSPFAREPMALSGAAS